MQYIIGVDCGGTTTVASAYDLNGNLLKQATGSFGNLVMDYSQAIKNIKATVEQLLESLTPGKCLRVVLGIAGIDAGGLKGKVTESLNNWNFPVTLMNDGQLAHYSILKGGNGAIIISGTGSVIIGRDEDSWYRIGGWGHLFGDQGSAYGISKEAIQYCLNEFDQGKKLSELSRAVLSFYEVENVLELTQKLYSLNKGDISKLALVISNLSQDNQQARTILENAGEFLGKSIIYLAEKMPKSTDVFQIGLNGSVIEKNHIVRQAFIRYLEQHLKQEFVIVEKETPCTSAAYYYQKRMEKQ